MRVLGFLRSIALARIEDSLPVMRTLPNNGVTAYAAEATAYCVASVKLLRQRCKTWSFWGARNGYQNRYLKVTLGCYLHCLAEIFNIC